MNMPDNYDLWSAYQNKIEAELEKFPKCTECGEPIVDDDCYEFDGDLICLECLNANHKKSIWEYIEE